MAGEAERLRKLSVAELRALARKAGLDAAGLKKGQLLETLGTLPNLADLLGPEPAEVPAERPAVPAPELMVTAEPGPEPPAITQAVLEAPAAPAEPLPGEPYRGDFERASAKVLRDAARAFGIEVRGSRKGSFVEAFIAQPRAGEIAVKVQELRTLEAEERETAAVGRDIEQVTQALQVPDLGDPATDPLLESAVKVTVDFAAAEDLLDQAHRRLEERIYDRALTASEEALSSARLSYDAFLNAAWAHTLLTAQQIILDAARGGANVERAVALLHEGKALFRAGTLEGNRDLLFRLAETSRALYSAELQRSREFLIERQQFVRQAANLGASVRAAEDLLAEATRASMAGDHKRSLELATQAETLAHAAVQAKQEDVRRQLESVARAVDATKRFGTDATAAEESLGVARRALENGQLLTASEYVGRAELQAQQAIQARALARVEPPAQAPAAQPAPVQPAAQPVPVAPPALQPTPPAQPAIALTPELQQVAERANRMLGNIAPVFEEAEFYRLDVGAGRQASIEAQQLLAAGNVDAALAAASRAEEAAKGTLIGIIAERQKQGIAKPAQGVCGKCGKNRLEFFDDGWGRCPDCGNVFRWRQLGEPPSKGLFRRRKR